MQNLKKVQICADSLKSLLPQGFSPQVGIVLGTGLGNLADSLQDGTIAPYNVLSGFPQSTVASHQGKFAAGLLSGVPVIMQQGRCHLYEGKTPAQVCMGVRVMAELGITRLVITNASGSINPLFPAGSLMIIEDQINFTGQSPLTGSNEESWGPRFPDMSRLYDPELIRRVEKTALGLGIRLEKGVYFCIPGPQLETRAETRAYRALGGDAVGMSTALEAIAARHRGLRVLGVACLANQNLPDCMDAMTIEEIIRTANNSSGDLARLLAAALPLLAAPI